MAAKKSKNRVVEFFKRNLTVQEGKVEVGGNNDWVYDTDAPAIEFTKCIYYYQHDPRIKLAVDSYTELIMGLDFVVNCKDKKATKIIEDFIENTNAHMKIKGAVTTMLACGESLVEKYSESDNPLAGIDEVDITTISDKARDKFGNVLKYVQTIKDEDNDLTPVSKFINFQLNPVTREKWAKPLAYPMLAPRELQTGYDRTLQAPIEAMWEIEDNMKAIFNNYAEPQEVYTFEGASKDFLKKMKQKFKERKRGEKIFTDRAFTKDIHEVNPQAKFKDFTEHLDTMADLSTQFSPQIFSAEFTARAASDTTDSVISRKVKALRKNVLWKCKMELFFPLLQANGYDNADKLNNLELTVDILEPEFNAITPADALARFTSGAWTLEDLRTYDKNQGADLTEVEDNAQTEAYKEISRWLKKE